MNLNFNKRQIPDEELFFLMSQGNKQAEVMLYQRYRFFGHQITGSLIRQIKQEKNISFTSEDFSGFIDDNIMKIFRYYSREKSLFYPFARDILNQTLARAVNLKAQELVREKEMISLDAPIRSDETTQFHEIVGASSGLSAGDQYDIDNYLETVFSSSNGLRAKAGKIYTMYYLGFSLREIAKKMHVSLYKVRRIINEVDEGNIIITID